MINTKNGSIVDEVTVGPVPQGIVVGPRATYAYVTSLWGGTLTLLGLK